MFKLLRALLVAPTLMVCCYSNAQTEQSGDRLPAGTFAQKIQQLPDAQVVDVRTPAEFSKEHLANALNCDWNGKDFQNEVSMLDKSKPVFVYCLSGGRSAAAARLMRSQGFGKVYELDGGILKWRAANLPETAEKPVSPGMSREQFEQLISADKPVLVDFYGDWCAPCRKMKPYLEEIAGNMHDRVAVIRINADDNQQLCKALSIDALPVLQLYKNKKLVWNNVGYIGKEDILKQLK